MLQMSVAERRRGLKPVPYNLVEYLTREQIKSLGALRQQGLVLFAVRRPLFQDPTVILKNLVKEKYHVLLKDGTVDYIPDIKIRS